MQFDYINKFLLDEIIYDKDAITKFEKEKKSKAHV
jgi:hypothetical protein